MESEEWFDKFSELVDGTVQSIQEDTDKVTGADVGLVLSIIDDYLDDPSGNAGRDLRAVRMAQDVLDLKYNTRDLSWFDLYELVVEMNSRVGRYREVEGEDLEGSSEDFYSLEEPMSGHTSEFQTTVQRLFEAVESEKAEELKSTDPYPKEDEAESFSHFKHGISTKVGFMYGSVEIPNNLSRMEASNKLMNHVKDLSEDDLKWLVRTLKEWIKSYARAEATVTNRNLTQEELRGFMIDEETPAEKYWK